MDIPRFSQENLNPKLCQQDVGCTFQDFIHDVLLADYPDLHLFPSLGKDGAIDLSQTMSASRTIVECKYIGKDSFEDSLSLWQNVALKLEKHLADPSGPTKGQAQYKPWYRTDLPIREYIFCISSELRNQNQIDEFKSKIAEFFDTLSIKHKHLNHLNHLSVKVIDWEGCCSLLKQRPHLIFRWFPRTRPQGLVPLYDSPDTITFRSYLNSEKLTYYSRSQHLKVKSVPQDINIPDEENLLDKLENSETTGLIVTGGGGVGKTRLMLEIGRLAQNKKWLVLRVQSRIKEDALVYLTERINQDTLVLLLVDYIEIQREFAELVETLNDLNDTYFLHLRYIACCRTSYYQTIASTPRHTRIDLSPPIQDLAEDWYKDYQRQTVLHILEQNGLEVTDRHLDICRNKPIFAVLISYLHNLGRQPDLAELLKEADFGIWIAKRLQLSFGQTAIDRDLAKFISFFPLQSDKVSLLNQKHGLLLDRLATDGWIEEQPADEFQNIDMWVIAHDVFADQILYSYIRSIPNTLERFIDELLSQAKSLGCLRSAIIILQRLQPELSSLSWSKILRRKISEDITEWSEVRDILIHTSLLSPVDKISMLGEQEEFWRGAELDLDFQNAIGWLTRWAINQKEPALDAKSRSIIDLWLRKASNYTTRSNFILTWGLRFSTEAIREPALKWIQTRPIQFQTHYLLVAWMECYLPLTEISYPFQQWIDKYKEFFHLSFVIKAWLDAGGDTKLVHQSIKAWLEKHGQNPEAGFVYESWLDAGGDTKLVHQSIKAWLEKHGQNPEAEFVYKSWLDAGGDTKLVHQSIKAWLEKHGQNPEAGFVYESWLDAGGDTKLVHQSIKAWLEKHGQNPEAEFVYKSWLDAGGDTKLVHQSIKAWLEKHGQNPEAEFVYKSWLDAGGDTKLVHQSIKAWLEKHGQNPEAGFVYESWLDAGGDTKLVHQSIKAWLEKHGQNLKADFVYKSWLEAGGEFSTIKSPAIMWMHMNYDKLEAVYLSKFLAKQRDIPIETVKDILKWCQKFPDNEDAIWRLNQLSGHLLNEEIGEEVISTSEIVLSSLILNRNPLKSPIRNQINILFSYLFNAHKLSYNPLINRVDTIFNAWIRYHRSFGGDLFPNISIQQLGYVERMVYLIDVGILNLNTDRSSIERFLYWVNNWKPERKKQLIPIFDDIKHKYPAQGLWEIVKVT